MRDRRNWTTEAGAAVLALCACAAGCSGGDTRPLEERVTLPDLTTMEPRVAQAIGAARDAAEADLGSADAWRKLGAVLDAHRLPVEAEAAYREALAIEPDDPWTLYQTASVIAMQGDDNAEGIRLFERFAVQTPGYPAVHLHIGRLYEAEGQLQEALNSYQRAVAIEGTIAIAQRSLGSLLLAMGQVDEAIVHLEKATELASAPDQPTWSYLAQAWQQKGDSERAAACADQARRSTPTLFLPDPMRREVTFLGVSSGIARARGKQRMAMGDWAGALSDFQIAAEAKPNDPELALRIATALMELGRQEEGRQALKRTIELRQQMAQRETDAPRPSEALIVLDGAISRFRNHYLPRAPGLQEAEDRARALAEEGKTAEAVAALEEQAGSAPLDARAEYAWGEILLAAGQGEPALEHFQRALELDIGYADGYYGFGRALEASGDAEQARAWYERAVRLDPYSPARQKLGP